jgi:hypothetical protein
MVPLIDWPRSSRVHACPYADNGDENLRASAREHHHAARTRQSGAGRASATMPAVCTRFARITVDLPADSLQADANSVWEPALAIGLLLKLRERLCRGSAWRPRSGERAHIGSMLFAMRKSCQCHRCKGSHGGTCASVRGTRSFWSGWPSSRTCLPGHRRRWALATLCYLPQRKRGGRGVAGRTGKPMLVSAHLLERSILARRSDVRCEHK